MQEAITKAIERQAKKLLDRQRKEYSSKTKNHKRFKVRTGNEPKVAKPTTPNIWKVHPHFDPKYCLKHSKYLGKTIWQKIQSREYKVTPAIKYGIPKENGDTREIMVFSIPDAAVANLFNRKLRDRNKNLQSPFCYSYRKDRSIFDAVLQTASIIRSNKNYIIQYDFSKYFDSIKHDYIRFVIDSDELLISPAEKYVIESFLTHEFASPKNYKTKSFEKRNIGVPQGCSMSLFLSNIAAHELDKKLEKLNGSFTRFADDIVCVTQNFEDALKVEDAFVSHGTYSGIKINYKKSDGIKLLDNSIPNQKREYFIDSADIGKLEMLQEFDYIGHKFSFDKISMSSRGIRRIKNKISNIIYLHLLLNPKRNLFSPQRIGIGFYDWDLVTCINEIKKYVYGGLKEKQLTAFIEDNKRIHRFKGLMSFYPLVTSVQQFSELDGWLVSTLRRAIKLRSKILQTNFGIILIPINDNKIIDGTWYNYTVAERIFIPETKAPSFVLAWRAARKAFQQYGLSDFEEPKYYSSLFTSY